MTATDEASAQTTAVTTNTTHAAAAAASMPTELVAELRALEDLATRHKREFIRLRTIHLSRLTGAPVKFTRDRMTQEQLAALPPVLDSTGVELKAGMKVRCPDGVRAEVVRVDKRSRRAVVARADSTQKMTVATRLTALNVRRSAPKQRDPAAA